MNRWSRPLLTAILLILNPCQAQPLLDRLPQGSIQSAFQILRRDYIRRDDLTYEELNRAALQGLLERLSFGAELVTTEPASSPVAPYVHAEFLAPGIAYLRPEWFQQGAGELFAEALEGLVEKKAEHLMLDLRGSAQGSFEEVALMLQCFIPNGEVMFKLKQLGQENAELFLSQREPLWKKQVHLLLDADTGNGAETLAACLRARGALVIGAKTPGTTVRYSEVRLDEKTLLRYASAEMLLPDGTSLFKVGIQPDYPLTLPTKDKLKIFSASRNHSMVPFVRDRVRPRFNEAALVLGDNPELDDYVRRSKGETLPGDESQLRDVVTQRTLDLLTSESFLSSQALKWDPKP